MNDNNKTQLQQEVEAMEQRALELEQQLAIIKQQVPDLAEENE